MDPDPAVDDHDGEIRKNSRSSSSSSTSSSSSSSSDEDDYFQIDTGELDDEKPILPPGGTVSDGFEFRQQQPPTQSPQVQVMPDPNRIPSSVFARNKSTAPMEWSVASNESLFSIHMGNSSFSRDHILLSMDSSLSPLPPLPLSPMPLMPPTSPPVGVAVGPDRDHVESAEPANSGTGDQAMKAEEEKLESERNKAPGDLMNNSTSMSRQSDGSTTSFSFAFPILSRESRSGSIKVEPEPQQQSQSDQLEKQQSPKTEAETSKTTSGTETKGWLSCFPCCSLCC